jgi:tRNA G10  N-methylase Trm11
MLYLAVLGQNKYLSLAEILAVYPKTKPTLLGDEAVILGSAEEIRIERLGGTPKIAKLLPDDPLSIEAAKKLIIKDLLSGFSGKKIFFGLSFYGNKNRKLYERLGKEIKKELKDAGEGARWVASRETALSSVIVKTNKLLTRGADYCLLFQDNKIYAAKTIGVQDFSDYEFRDVGRPCRDLYSGMTPSKLAKLLINLGGKQEEILDPFCGSGTFLSEAAMLGFKKIYGSDISDKAVSDSRKNMEWLSAHYKFSAETKIQKCDIINIVHCWNRQFAYVVTEPYLGPAIRGAADPAKAGAYQKEFNLSYNIYLRSLGRIIKKGATLILIVPFVISRGKNYKTSLKIKENGFVAVHPLPENIYKDFSIDYSRPDQKIGREIYILKKI